MARGFMSVTRTTVTAARLATSMLEPAVADGRSGGRSDGKAAGMAEGQAKASHHQAEIRMKDESRLSLAAGVIEACNVSLMQLFS